jgi:hypothetical protein
MAMEQGRTRNDTESRLAQGAGEDERFRRQLLRTLKEVVRREFDVGPLPGNLKAHRRNSTATKYRSAYPIRRKSRPTIPRRPAVSLGGPLYKVAQ